MLILLPFIMWFGNFFSLLKIQLFGERIKMKLKVHDIIGKLVKDSLFYFILFLQHRVKT